MTSPGVRYQKHFGKRGGVENQTLGKFALQEGMSYPREFSGA